MKKIIKLLILYMKLKLKGYNKEQRFIFYAVYGFITFEQYEKFMNNKVMKGGE